MHIFRALVSTLPVLAAASTISSSQPIEDHTNAPENAESIGIHVSSQMTHSEAVSSPSTSLEEHRLELRQAVTPGAAGAAATTVATQQSPVTTEWVPSVLNPSSTPYVEVVYTQTFASVPSQLPSAASGSIGLGTITGQVGVVHTTTAETENGVSSAKAGMWSLRAMVGVAAFYWFLL